MTMWTGGLEGEVEVEVEEGTAAAEERSERVVAMRDGTRNENATRLWGAIETDVNEDRVAPWKVDVGVDADGGGMGSDFGCAEIEPGESAGAGCCGATLGMNDVTTATGCAVSRRSARIFWESPRALVLLAAERSKEDQRFAVAVASATTGKRDITCMRPGERRSSCSCPSARAGMSPCPVT
jgi:hypothetical protein